MTQAFTVYNNKLCGRAVLLFYDKDVWLTLLDVCLQVSYTDKPAAAATNGAETQDPSEETSSQPSGEDEAIDVPVE